MASLDIDFPFKNGVYYVVHGGGLSVTNYHADNKENPYAYDIVKLDQHGRAFDNAFSMPVNNKYHYIFNDTVYSPCDAIVSGLMMFWPDHLATDFTNVSLPYNIIILKKDNNFIHLVHLKQNSQFIQKGDVLKKGQPIALVGNSGPTFGPHLHIQAFHHNKKQDIYDPILIKFNGKVLMRNHVVNRVKTTN